MKKKFCRPAGILSAFLLQAVYFSVHAQTRTVTGTVNDGEKPLSGVVVTQEGSSQFATTSSTGAFSLLLTGDHPVLVFRHPEYTERRITADGRTVYTISLEEKVNTIQEVVLNAGYYDVKAKESTGSIAKVTAKDIENQPLTNVLSAVQGRMAGVSITQNSGTPGGGFDVQIRGRNSLRNVLNSSVDGNQPLYVIDGVALGSGVTPKFAATIIPLQNISPLNGISPGDIESIEILKDADATAIYGSRGANGVILITTRKGKGRDLGVKLNVQYGLSNPARLMKLMNTAEYTNMRRQAYANAGTPIPANAYDINGTWDETRSTDWQRELIGNGAEHRTVQASVSGGNRQNSFMLSASHQNQSTVFPGDFRYKTNILNSSYQYRSLNERLHVQVSNTFSELKNNVVGNDLTTKALTLSPNAPALYDAAGNLNWENNTFTNPIAALNGTYSNELYQLNQNVALSYQFLKDFTLKMNGGLNYQNFEEFSLQPHTMYNPSFGLTSGDSSSSNSAGSVLTWIAEPQLNWDKQFGNHELKFLVGSSFQQTVTKTEAITGVGFSSNALLYNIAASAFKIMSPDLRNQYKYASLFGRLNYQFRNRYILNLTARRDGSSRFGPDNRFANFGAVGAAWIFSEESFLKDFSWLSFGKVRGSFGVTGSDFIGDYQYLDSYSLAGNAYNNNTGLIPARLFNSAFSWEETKKREVAVEIGLFRRAVNFVTAYYNNRSSGQLVGIPLPSTTGFTSVQSNLDAVVQNRGWEFEVSVSPLRSSPLQWESSFNINFPENKLLSFPNLEGSTYATKYRIGMPTSIVLLYDYTGINSSGQYTFTDYNGDGKISAPDDAQAIRDIAVKYFGGWQNELRYKNVTLSFLFQFVKQTNWNFFRTMTTAGNMNNQPAELVNVWSESNPNGIIMPYSPGTVPQVNTLVSNFRGSTAAVGDASFIRLKNIQVNYRIPSAAKWLKEATVYFQGQNLVTVTDYFGLDPEFVTTGFLPPMKTVSFGFQLQF